LSEAAAIRLEAGLQQLGFENADVLAKRLLAFADLLLAANVRTNLVGAKNADELVATHFLDSLAPLAGAAPAAPIVDLGSGAGLPGIPAALAWPGRRFVLIEPRAKRAQFLKDSVQALGVSNAEVLQMSAESAGRGAWRGKAGTVLVRALAKPARALELALPLLRPKGRAVLYQGRASAPGAAEQAVMQELGGHLLEARRVVVPYLDAQRHVWIIEKRDSAKRSRRSFKGARRT
jgi:16S rRNA (guanine527-N7)-methyltransferase